MTSTINARVAEEHVADLRRVAGRRHGALTSRDEGYAARVELRLAEADEVHVVRQLADLDDACPLEGPVLLALLDGDAVAGLALRDRRVVANPFVPADEAVALLRLRAEHLSSVPVRRRLWHLPRLRLARPARRQLGT
jgi:hypothetical protein